VWVPEAGWVDVDPTNDRFVGPRHVTTAWGRDYGDVPPLKGVIYTEGKEHELSVAVDVVALDG
jgi:transglutaminase-like putative cysteine protease